jgi:hypothetical protein
MASITLVLRIATAAQGPTDWDSSQYASAVGHFDVTHGQPQPPGYWLYVEAGRVVSNLTGLGVVHSLVVVAALASAVAVGMTVAAGQAMGGRWLGIAAGAIVATSPFAWFSGSVVATYSFDALACSVLLVLAWNARPGSRHGIAAVVTLGVLAGFRPSVIQAFAIVAALAIVGSTRTWRRAIGTAAAAVGSVAVWFVPMVLQQPGGASAWLRATRAEATGALHATSILDHAAGGPTNLGTFAGYTVMALAPLAVVSVLAGAVLGIQHLIQSRSGTSAVAGPGGADTSGFADTSGWQRPWYQRRTAVLGAAIVPPAAIVALVEFAKGGYLLAYLPAAVIALLLPVDALVRSAAVLRPGPRHGHRHRATTARARTGTSPVWLALASLAVAGVVALGAQRFLFGKGVLPQRWLRATTGGLWVQQARYQAPYADTRSAITEADAVDAALRGLGPSVDPSRDVVVFDTLDGGDQIYRNAGWSLPQLRIALIGPGTVLYNELHGALYYASGATVTAGVAGSVFLVASPALPGIASLTAQGYAIPVAIPRPIGGYLVWRLLPGSTVLGVHTDSRAGPRPLGSGIPT